ncbi:hypothetical protein Q31a_06520 [Aureliella helgolandensis]|uniref:LarA-like N-terminal domain-containing protein n=2 Tax=Aureliella helgolandensis TaxID=2527968 RepID=A0A518G188_9BACT|nr:hypothetical protein Q31a_06520 [Aureliella helgolandensis]
MLGLARLPLGLRYAPNYQKGQFQSNIGLLRVNSSISVGKMTQRSHSIPASFSLEFGAEKWHSTASNSMGEFPSPVIEPCGDLVAAVAQALSQPIDFPPLADAVMPDDQVVFAVDPSLPSLVEVVCEVLKWFVEHGTEPHNMHVVVADNQTRVAEDLTARLHEQISAKVSVESHDPDNPEGIAYVAANEESDPIYLNRRIVDADVVVPITCARPASALDYMGVFSVFPLFSDRKTRGNFYSLPKLGNAEEHQQLKHWADQAAWWLGLLFGIQVVPAGGNQVAEILAGQTEPLEQACQTRMNKLWQADAQPADLVVALLDGAPSQHGWYNVARALYNANQCVAPGGSIVVCSNLVEAVGSGLRRLRETHDTPEDIAKRLAKDAHDDALAASVVLEALADHHVYLVSQLRKETVESLGIGVIENEQQLVHLMSQHATCAVLRAAQHLSILPN